MTDRSAVSVRRDHRLALGARMLLGIEILRAYARAHRLVHSLPLPQAVQELRVRHRNGPVSDPDPNALARHLAWATVKTIRRLPTDSRCLMRSVTLLELLAARGIRATLCVSVSPAPEFESHAWIEHDGEPLLEPAGPDHRLLLSL